MGCAQTGECAEILSSASLPTPLSLVSDLSYLGDFTPWIFPGDVWWQLPLQSLLFPKGSGFVDREGLLRFISQYSVFISQFWKRFLCRNIFYNNYMFITFQFENLLRATAVHYPWWWNTSCRIVRLTRIWEQEFCLLTHRWGRSFTAMGGTPRVQLHTSVQLESFFFF